MAPPASASAHAHISQIASLRRVHEAFQWLHLKEQQILQWQMDLVAIPAPPFAERERALWLLQRFEQAGLEQAHLDDAGNVIARLPGTVASPDCVLLSAHIDTVFPGGTPIEIRRDSLRIEAPGACDNGSGVSGLLALATAMTRTGLAPRCDLYFVGNVGEEGEGNLRGMRHVYDHAPWRERIAAHLVLDGAGHEIAVTTALGSRRFLVTVCGPGGHSWTDAGRPNPIVVLSDAIGRLRAAAETAAASGVRSSWNVGTIEGGSSVNAIPERAEARFDLRSTDAEELVRLEVALYRAVEDAVLASATLQEKPGDPQISFEITQIGDRPAGALPEGARILGLLRAVDRHLQFRTELRTASTDANIPLSRGVEAVAIGAGGDGGGIHTRGEWYDARGRDLGLRRVLLLLLALADCDEAA
jgi:acetylornithine deacetylase/succinyl-diaminopimelate desuccinylase-like protein